MNSKVFIKIEETFNDFKALVPRYLEVYNNEELLDMFLSRNRNPIFDLSNYKMFKSGLQSKGALMESDNKKKTQDHFIQRKKAMKHIFDYLVANPSITLDEFTTLLFAFVQTVTITKEEHKRVTALAKKKKDKYNYELYAECGIKVKNIKRLLVDEMM